MPYSARLSAITTLKTNLCLFGTPLLLLHINNDLNVGEKPEKYSEFGAAETVLRQI